MKKVETSRREFLCTVCKGAVGAAALTVLPAMATRGVAEGEKETPAYPWKYTQLDPEKVKQVAYDSFYSRGGCCAGAFAGIVETLAEEVGYPYNVLPSAMFAYGAGGYGAATLCGSLGGACAAIGLFCEAAEARALRDALYDWYKTASFPMYQPKMESVTTVSNSILCAESVGIYMEKTGYAMGDDGRKARCAGVTADTAAKAVELLNAHFGFTAPVEAAPTAEEALAENEYIGVGKGYGGDIKVKVTMDGDKISAIKVLEHGETAGVSDPAFNAIPDAVIAAQSTQVDTVSNATFTSKGLIEAINNALAQVKK